MANDNSTNAPEQGQTRRSPGFRLESIRDDASQLGEYLHAAISDLYDRQDAVDTDMMVAHSVGNSAADHHQTAHTLRQWATAGTTDMLEVAFRAGQLSTLARFQNIFESDDDVDDGPARTDTSEAPQPRPAVVPTTDLEGLPRVQAHLPELRSAVSGLFCLYDEMYRANPKARGTDYDTAHEHHVTALNRLGDIELDLKLLTHDARKGGDAAADEPMPRDACGQYLASAASRLTDARAYLDDDDDPEACLVAIDGALACVLAAEKNVPKAGAVRGDADLRDIIYWCARRAASRSRKAGAS